MDVDPYTASLALAVVECRDIERVAKRFTKSYVGYFATRRLIAAGASKTSHAIAISVCRIDGRVAKRFTNFCIGYFTTRRLIVASANKTSHAFVGIGVGVGVRVVEVGSKLTGGTCHEAHFLP